MHLPATPTALLFAYAFLSNIALAVVPRRAGRHRRGGRASSPPHDDESRRLPFETRGREAHLGPVLVPLVRRYSMNPIRHCAFAVVLSLAVNRLPPPKPPPPPPPPGGPRPRPPRRPGAP